MQSKCLRLERCERLLARCRPRSTFTSSPPPIELDDRLALRLVVLDHEQVADTARSMNVAIAGERLVEPLARDRLLEERDGAGAQAPAGAVRRRRRCAPGCAASRGACFSRSSTVQPSITGSSMSSMIASGWYSCASARPVSPRSATSPLKPRSRATSSTVRANRRRPRRRGRRGRRPDAASRSSSPRSAQRRERTPVDLGSGRARAARVAVASPQRRTAPDAPGARSRRCARTDARGR